MPATFTTIFHRQMVRKNRNRAARTGRYSAHNFLFRETANRLQERLQDVMRDFQNILDLGCHGGEVGQWLDPSKAEVIVQCDIADKMVRLASAQNPEILTVIADEEYLPFGTAKFDLVISNLSLHWVNDLLGALIQIYGVLKPDGLFLGCLLGGQTLQELRASLLQAETQILGGAGPHIAPFADVRDLGGLLQRAGFALPVADIERIEVSYAHIFDLLADLRAMGENNALLSRPSTSLSRTVLMEAGRIYQKTYGDQSGRIVASFDVIFLHGWHPHARQQQPLKPGAATRPLSDIV